MQSAEKINKITHAQSAEVKESDPAIELHLSWIFFQFLLCTLAILTLVATKELSPQVYGQMKELYEQQMSASLFTEDSKVTIIDEE